MTNAGSSSQKYDPQWLVPSGIIVALAAFLRFYDLSLKPFHHDEGVNGHFLMNLFRNGIYTYDPANYHGPTLYYISLAFSKLFGLNTFAVRASVAIFGVLMVVLALYLRRFIGDLGALAAALFLALSPGMVFISRYFIHEIFFVFLALAFALSILLFITNRSAGTGALIWMGLLLAVCIVPLSIVLTGSITNDPSVLFAVRIGLAFFLAGVCYLILRQLSAWNSGRPIYLLLASASASLMFATKETAFITLGTMAIAVISIWIWQKLYKKRSPADEISDADDAVSFAAFRDALGSGRERAILIGMCVLVFAYVFVLFFSSYFTFSSGISKAFEAYAIWTKTGTKDHTQSGLWGYLSWLWPVEAPLLVLSFLGTLIAFLKGRHKVAMFFGLTGVGILLAYSIVPYKTPWLALSFLLPMAVASGYAVNEIAKLVPSTGRIAAYATAAIAAAILGYHAYSLNFVNYDDNSRTYVYAHTRREFLTMMSHIEKYAEKSGQGTNVGVDVVSPDYWPMVWYTRDYTRVGYHARMIDNSTAEMIVAKKTEQDRDVVAKYGSRYKLDGVYPLRPGVDLMLLVRNELADPIARDLTSLK